VENWGVATAESRIALEDFYGNEQTKYDVQFNGTMHCEGKRRH